MSNYWYNLYDVAIGFLAGVAYLTLFPFTRGKHRG